MVLLEGRAHSVDAFSLLRLFPLPLRPMDALKLLSLIRLVSQHRPGQGNIKQQELKLVIDEESISLRSSQRET